MTLESAAEVLLAAKTKPLQYRQVGPDGIGEWQPFKFNGVEPGPDLFNFQRFDFRIQPEPIRIWFNKTTGRIVDPLASAYRDMDLREIGYVLLEEKL